MPQLGIEPRTQGFSVPCSTNWAIAANSYLNIKCSLQLYSTCSKKLIKYISFFTVEITTQWHFCLLLSVFSPLILDHLSNLQLRSHLTLSSNSPHSMNYQILTIFFPFSSVQSLNHVRLFATPWIAACQASLSITNSWSLLKHMSIESVMPSSHLVLCHPLPLLPSIFPSIRVFSNESVLCNRWPKYWCFIFNISPSNEYSRLISFRID